jgi:hypothetical protein
MNTLEIPQQFGFSPASGGFTPNVDPLDGVIDRMVHEESGGNPMARSPKGALGLLQVMPATAAQYGVSDPRQLFDPVVNRRVAKAYLMDLFKKYNGNMHMALAAYNAGPGNVDKGTVPRSTLGYVGRILQNQTFAAGGTAEAAEPPDDTSLPPPPGFKPYTPGATPSAATAPDAELPPPPGYKPYKSPAAAALAAQPLPWDVRATDWAPLVGQFVGEYGLGVLGALAGFGGGAAVGGPADVTGVPEVGGAYGGWKLGKTIGGGLGSGGGQEIANLNRQRHGLPPSGSVPWQTGIGAATSGIGLALPYVAPVLGRVRRARQAAQALEPEITAQTGKALEATQIGKALEKAKASKVGQFARTLGMTAQQGVSAVGEAAWPLRDAYYQAQRKAERAIGKLMEKVIEPYQFARVHLPKAFRLLRGGIGRDLAQFGPGLPSGITEALEDSQTVVAYTKNAMGQRVIPVTKGITIAALHDVEKAIGQVIRSTSQDNQLGISALNELRQAVRDDINQKIGPQGAQMMERLRASFARVEERWMPGNRALHGVSELGQAAEAILKHGKGAETRTVKVIEEMIAGGHGNELRRAVAGRIWKQIMDAEPRNPTEALKALVATLKRYPPEVFDALFGKGEHIKYVQAAKNLLDFAVEAVEEPAKGQLLHDAVSKYLKRPGKAEAMAHFVGHRLVYGVMFLVAESGSLWGRAIEIGTAGTTWMLASLYAAWMHSPKMMARLERWALSPTFDRKLYALIAAIDVGLHYAATELLDPPPPPPKTAPLPPPSAASASSPP